METINISVAKDFSKTPGPRYIKEGSFSAELFLKTILDTKFKDVLSRDAKIVINLDGTLGYGTSFLEEVFGGLARTYGANNVSKKIEIVSTEEEWLLRDIEIYVKDVERQNK